MEDVRYRRLYITICFLLAAAVAGVYWPVRNYDFVKFDDNLYVTENQHVTSGLSWQNIRWAFTSGYASNWHPLTWISHMADCTFYDLRPGMHHLVNAVIHTANTVLLFAVFEYMTGALWASAFIAGVFGQHPLHVESVAWVSERKDVLSTFFMILTIWMYAGYARYGGWKRYVGASGLFALGLMAKPMLVTVPFVLLLLDYWPLNRLDIGDRKGIYSLVLEKVPFLALSAVSSVVTFVVQRSSGAMKLMEYYSFKVRLANAVVSYADYMRKMVWPNRLAALYPHPGEGLTAGAVWGCALVLAALTACFIYLGRQRKYLAVGWLWYIGMLVPVIGLVQVGSQALADRYTYMPLTGLFIILAWGAGEFTSGLAGRKVILAVLAAVVLCGSAAAARRQAGYWKNSLTLFEHSLAVSPSAWTVANNYGNTLKEAGRAGESIKYFEMAIQMKPDFAEAYHNLGNSFRAMDRLDDAVACYKKAIEFKPYFFLAYAALAETLERQGKNDEALVEFHKALKINPDDVETITNLGSLYMGMGQADEAIRQYRRAIELKPDYVIAHGRLGLALAAQGKNAEALNECEIVLKTDPNDVEMRCNIGILLERLGRYDEAERQYRQALQIKPGDEKAQGLLTTLLKKKESR